MQQMFELPAERLTAPQLTAALHHLDIPLTTLLDCVAACGCCIDQTAWRATGSGVAPHDAHLFWLHNHEAIRSRST